MCDSAWKLFIQQCQDPPPPSLFCFEFSTVSIYSTTSKQIYTSLDERYSRKCNYLSLQVLFWSPTSFSWSSRGCHCSTWNLPWASTTVKGQLQFGKYAPSLKVSFNTNEHQYARTWTWLSVLLQPVSNLSCSSLLHSGVLPFPFRLFCSRPLHLAGWHVPSVS